MFYKHQSIIWKNEYFIYLALQNRHTYWHTISNNFKYWLTQLQIGIQIIPQISSKVNEMVFIILTVDSCCTERELYTWNCCVSVTLTEERIKVDSGSRTEAPHVPFRRVAAPLFSPTSRVVVFLPRIKRTTLAVQVIDALFFTSLHHHHHV